MRIVPDDLPFSLLTLAGVVFLFVREILGITTVLQRRIINPFNAFKYQFVIHFIFVYLSRVMHSVIKEKLIYNVPCLKNLC